MLRSRGNISHSLGGLTGAILSCVCAEANLTSQASLPALICCMHAPALTLGTSLDLCQCHALACAMRTKTCRPCPT